MQISYKKLWVLLAQMDMSKAELRRAADITPAILTKLNKNEIVSMSMLIKICVTLKCDIGDIMEIVYQNN